MTRRIDTVVRIRRLQEQLASGEVARARHTLTRARSAEQDAWQLLDERAVPRSRTARDLVAERTMIEGGLVHARSLGDATDLALHHADLAVDEWRGALRELDGIERLSERIATAERVEEERKAGIELDDLVVMRWKRSS